MALVREEKRRVRQLEIEAEEARTAESRALHKRCTEHYFAEFERLRGCKLVGFDGGDGAALKLLIKKLHSREQDIRSVITAALGHRLLGEIASIKIIARDPQRYQRPLAPSRGRNVQAAHPGPTRYLGDS